MSFLKLNSLDINNIKITYRDEGVGAPLVFLHGLAGNSKSWKHQLPEFSQTSRAIAWDAPGYGGSSILPPDLEIFGDTLKTFIVQLGLNKIILVGHSMGGIIATHLAAKHPALIKSLVLSCTHSGHCSTKGLPLNRQYVDRINSLIEGPAERYGEECAKRILTANASKSALKMVANIAAETRQEGLETASRIIQEANNIKKLQSLHMPITVISGELDTVVSEKRTNDLLQLVPHAKHLRLSNVGHAPYAEDPVQFNQALKSSFK